MLTRCPACGTTFRLRPEQIAKAQGRVRCGKCQTPFSAVDNRIDGGSDPADFVAPEPPESRPPSLPPSTPQFSAVGQRKRFLAQRDPSDSTASDQAATLGPDDVTLPPEQPTLPQDAQPAEEDAAAPGATTAESASEAVPESADESVAQDGDTAAPPATDETSGAAEEPASDETEAAADEDEDAAAEDAATDDADDASAPVTLPPPDDYLAPARPARLWPWAAGTGLLALALTVQAAYAFRTDIAKRHPDWRPALESACKSLGCVVEMPRDADLVSIVSSELNPESDKSRLHLEAHLKNRADYPQAYPFLELTLTDVRDQPVIRRVFEPKDYLPANAPPEFRAGTEVTVKLLLDVGDTSASGYRVYVFYP